MKIACSCEPLVNVDTHKTDDLKYANQGDQYLEEIFYCTTCNETRCDLCSVHEVLCYYCPSCLFEMPLFNIANEKARCNRNCFDCPICESVLLVMAGTDESNTAPQEQQAQIYFLFCGFCHWNSKSEIGMTFDKPVGIASHVTKLEEQSTNTNSEFLNLKSFYERKINSLVSVEPPSLDSIKLKSEKQPSLISKLTGNRPLYTKILGSLSNSPYKGPKLSAEKSRAFETLKEKYTPVSDEGKKELELVDRIQLSEEEAAQKLHLSESLQCPSIDQMLNQNTNENILYPVRTALRTKRSKRCKTCQHILSKPEPKAQSAKFKLKILAMDFIPMISLYKITPINEQQTSVSLKIINPLVHDIKIISISTPNLDSTVPLSYLQYVSEENSKINGLPTDSFIIPGYSEFDDDVSEKGKDKSIIIVGNKAMFDVFIWMKKPVNLPLRVEFEYETSALDSTTGGSNFFKNQFWMLLSFQ